MVESYLFQGQHLAGVDLDGIIWDYEVLLILGYSVPESYLVDPDLAVVVGD